MARKSLVLAALSLSCVALAHVARAGELPNPPAGYRWQQIPDIKAAFLEPDGWHFKVMRNKHTVGVFITQEEIADSNGHFDTGLTVNVVRGLREPAGPHAKEYIGALAAKNGSQVQEKTMGPFQAWGCRGKASDSGGTSVTQNLAIVNPRTNTLYLLVFESPEKDWAAAWAKGEQMLKKFQIDDEI
jgi:hypothetical protein